MGAVVSNRSVTRARRNKIVGTNSVGNGIRNKAKIRDSKKHKKVKNYVVKSQIGLEVKDCNIFKSKKSGETNQGQKTVQSKVISPKSKKLSLKVAKTKGSKNGKQIDDSAKNVKEKKITSKKLETIPNAKNTTK